MKRPRLPAILFLLLLFLSSVGWLLSLDWKTRLSTDVMELIPDRSPNSELALGRSVLNDVFANRVMVALRSVDDPLAVEAYTAVLEDSPLVERVTVLADADALTEVGRFVFEHRFALLFPQWLQAQGAASTPVDLAGQVVSDLDAALNDPGFVAYEASVPGDPLLLMRDAADAFQTAQPSEALPALAHLLEVNLAVSALHPEGQGPVFELLDAAREAAAELAPGIVALDTGAHRYAAETEREMRREVRTLNLSTALAVLLICIVLCRRVLMVAHVFAILVLSLFSGLALMMACFEQVHVFALIFGCVLCGVIVDYALHAYLHDAGRGRRSLATFSKPFLISCGSTLMGFTILLLSDLPVLRQMGLLVVCSLAMAVVVTLVYVFGLLRHSSAAALPLADRLCAVSPQQRPGSATPIFGTLHYALGGLLVLGVLALSFVHWEDDIRNLKYPLPHLDAVDAEIRELHGGGRIVLLTVGEDYASSRQRLEALSDWLAGEGAPESECLSAGAWVPTLEAYRAAGHFIEEHPRFGATAVAALAAGGYEASAFAPFLEAWDGTTSAWVDYEVLVADFSRALAGGLTGMVGSDGDLHWWVTLVDATVPLGEIPESLDTLRLSQVESMSSVLSDYRARTLSLSLVGGAAMYGVLLFAFGFKGGSRIALVPVLSVLGAVVAVGSTGSLDLFHLIGFFLGACLALDYAVFSWMGFRRARRIPFSVVVSACTTVVSFFILGWSRIPAIHALGIAVALVTLLGALGSYFLIPRLVPEKDTEHAP